MNTNTQTKVHALSNLQQICYWEILLNDKEMAGYDISKNITARGLSWSHQQIYRELNKMNKLGILAKASRPQEGKPDRYVYDFADLVVVEENYDALTTEVVVSYEFLQTTENMLEAEYVRYNNAPNAYRRRLHRMNIAILKNHIKYLEQRDIENNKLPITEAA